MSYNIVKTNGAPLATVADGQTNSTATSLTLIGKNYAGYGTFLNENLIKMLENFANSTEPLYPLVGQLWWKSDTRLLQVYDSNGSWKAISGAQSLSDAPSTPLAGDLWWDTRNQQLKTYSGAAWVVIGPSFTATTGQSGAVADTIYGTDGPHVVVKFFVQNTLVAILSKDAAFNTSPSIQGFSTVKPGLNFSSVNSPSLVYYDTALNALNLGNEPASSYVKKGAPLFSGKVQINSENGIEILNDLGTISYFEINQSQNAINLISHQQNYGLNIRIAPDVNNGNLVDVISVNKTTGLVTVANDPTAPLGVATKNYVDVLNAAQTNALSLQNTNLSTQIQVLASNVGGVSPGGSIYANVRATQAALGYNVSTAVPHPGSTWYPSLSSGVNSTAALAYTRITTGDTFAGNVLNLWANVAAIHANVLSNPGTAGAVTASFYSNIVALQSAVTALNAGVVKRDGTNSVTGVIKPDSDAGTTPIAFGATDKRWGQIYGSTMSLKSSTVALINAGTDKQGSIGESGARFGTMFVDSIDCNNIVVGGVSSSTSVFSVTGTTNRITVSGLLGSGGAAGVGPYSNQVTLSLPQDIHSGATPSFTGIAKGGTNGTGDIGASGARFGAGYINQVRLKVVSGVALVNDGTDKVGDIGASGARFNTVYSDVGNFNSISINGTSLSTAVTSVTGTTNQVTVTGTGAGPYTGAVTISLPQNIHTAATPTFSGVTASSITKGGTSGTGDIGASGQTFGTVWATTFSGVSTTAKYADLAERFLPDAEYAPGTVVRIGGDKEITQETDPMSGEVFGVVSTDPAYKMNSELENGLYVAMIGRVPVRVIGTGKKGQRLVSAGNGCARAVTDVVLHPLYVIGRLLVDKDTPEESLVEAVVRINC